MFIVKLSQDRSNLNVKLHEDFQIIVVSIHDPYMREKSFFFQATLSLTITKIYVTFTNLVYFKNQPMRTVKYENRRQRLWLRLTLLKKLGEAYPQYMSLINRYPFLHNNINHLIGCSSWSLAGFQNFILKLVKTPIILTTFIILGL